jgi:hypothetical protein
LISLYTLTERDTTQNKENLRVLHLLQAATQIKQKGRIHRYVNPASTRS